MIAIPNPMSGYFGRPSSISTTVDKGPSETPRARLGVTGRPTDDELRVRFPEHDFDGYWFFAGLDDDVEPSALVFGLSVGANDGYDWGFRPVVGDPDFGIVACQLVTADRAVGFARQPVHRHEFTYDRRRLDVRIGDDTRLAVVDGRLSVRLVSGDGECSLELEGVLPESALWTPDMIFRATAFVSVAMTGITFEGEWRERGTTRPVRGVGTLDHPMGRVRRSAVSTGMGWWEYNCFRLDGGHSLFQWYIVDRDGGVTLATAATDHPDGELHVGPLRLAHDQWEDRGPVMVPRRWQARAELDHGVYEYEVVAAGPPWDGTPHERGQPLPNFLLTLDGTFAPSEGQVRRLHGVGTGETVVSDRDPFRGDVQAPW